MKLMKARKNMVKKLSFSFGFFFLVFLSNLWLFSDSQVIFPGGGREALRGKDNNDYVLLWKESRPLVLHSP